MEDIFGLSSKALEVAEKRSVLLSGNIANASTPQFKAKDIDFQKVLREEAERLSNGDSAESSAATGEMPIVYRVPMQKSLDGNTVDEDLERKNFLDNALHYQVGLTFIQTKSDQILKAIKGE